MTLDVSTVSFWGGRVALRLAIDGGTSTQKIARLLLKEAKWLEYPSCNDEHVHTALEVAASAGHLEAMGRLLEAGADPNAPVDFWGISALEAAAAQGQLVAVQKLLEIGAYPDHCNCAYDSWSTTPLIAATKAGHMEICKALLQAGADVCKVVRKSLRVETSAIKVAAECSNVTLLELFLGVVTDAVAQYQQKDVAHLLQAATRSIDAALVVTAATGDMLALQMLLDAGVDVNAHQAIADAAAEGHLEVMNKLLQNASDHNNLPVDSVTWALQLAVDAGNMEMMAPLLQAGATPNKIDIREAAAKGHFDVLAYMLQSGARAEITPRTDEDEDSEDEGNEDEEGEDEEGEDEDGEDEDREYGYSEGTALQWAAKEGHLAVVDLLLAGGADVNAPATETLGGTAVQLAFSGGHVAVTGRLLSAGADINVMPSEFADIALRAAALELQATAGNVVSTAEGIGNFYWDTALSVTAEEDKPDLVAKLFSVMPRDVARRKATEALEKAVKKRHPALVRQLLHLHPDVDFYKPSRSQMFSATMVQVAVANGDLDILQMLLSEKADVNLNPSERWQKTALQSASEQGSLDVVELLLDAGAEVNVTGSTAPPLLLAIQHGHKQVFERLLEAGADIHATAYQGQTMLQAAEHSEVTGMEELVRAALDSRPQPQTEQSLGRGTGPLCDACRTASLADLFCDETRDSQPISRSLLHPSLTALRASALAGCPFCCFVWKRLGITSISLPQPSPVQILRAHWPLRGCLTCEVTEPVPISKPKRLQFDFHYATGPIPEYRVPITENTSSPETYKQIKTWLDVCNDQHPKCRGLLPGSPFLPTRLIYLDLSADSASDNPFGADLKPRLVMTKGMESSKSRYIALTYRWPEDFPAEAKSTQRTIDDRMRGLNTSRLPRSFKDVFQVAAKLGISYVWIDSLCILQNEEGKADWNHEAGLMSQVYQNAYLTLAIAVPPTEPLLGLFRCGDPSDILSERLACQLEDGSNQEVVVMKAQRETYGSSPLVSRGWCFQEREISQRVVHYTETQVLWECRTVRASEGLPDGVGTQSEWPAARALDAWPRRILDNDLSKEDINNAWHQAVEDYSARDLTEATDKLPALAGLAAAVHDRYKPATCRYLAGLWEDDFRSSLAWRPAHNIAKRYPTYVAPTWSWASVAGPVSYFYLNERTKHCNRSGPRSDVDGYLDNDNTRAIAQHALQDSDAKYALQVLDVSVQTATSDPFGAIDAKHASAVLRCTAGLVPAVLDYSFIYGPENSLALANTVNKEEIGFVQFDVPLSKPDAEREGVFCIPLGVRGCCDLALVVVPTGNLENEYRRVGLVPGISRGCFTSAQIKQIAIV